MIYDSDLKILASERMTDDSDGGGRVTSNEIVDNVANNIFPVIASGDRIIGRIWLRKIYAGVRSENVDRLRAARVILTEAPSDPYVSVAMFSTGSYTDSRLEMQEYVESYQVAGGVSDYTLYYNHVLGQRMVMVFSDVSTKTPEIGQVFVLSYENSGGAVSYSQYIQITKVEKDTLTLTDPEGKTYNKSRFTLGISDKLYHSFPGSTPARSSALGFPTTVVRGTTIADSASVKGIVDLVEDGEIGDLSIKASSIFTRLVPSTESEIPVLDVSATGASSILVNTGIRTFSISQASQTKELKIAANNRQSSYVFSLIPKPSQTSTVVSYRSNGKWYEIKDLAGTGTLTGNGSGQIIYTTGSCAVTLQELPDVESSIIVQWGTSVAYTNRSGGVITVIPSIKHTCGYQGLSPQTVSITWTSNGQQKTATDTAIIGLLSGDGSGTVDYSSGKIILHPVALPAAASGYSVSYNKKSVYSGTVYSFGNNGGNKTFAIGNVDCLPMESGTAYIVISGYVTGYGYHKYSSYTLSDDGQGHLLGNLITSGSINYTTGEISILLKSQSRTYYNAFTGAYVTANLPFSPSQAFWRVRASSGSPDSVTETGAIQSVKLDITTSTDDVIAAGSVRITLGSVVYQDNEGVMSYSGGAAGSIDYETGEVVLSYWSGSSTVLTVNSLVTIPNQPWASDVYFRTPGAPIKPGGLQISATAIDGSVLAASADMNGLISGDAEGSIIYDFGQVVTKWGAWVVNANLTNAEKLEPWYNAANVRQDGYIWRPTPVFPTTERFNCVVYSRIPLQAALLGLDPVKLPVDGKVPCFRLGDTAALHHTVSHTMTNPLSGNTTVDLGRTRIARIRVYDTNGLRIPDTKYTTNLDAGTITFVSSLNLSGYVQPIIVKDTIIDEFLVTDVSIDGTMKISSQLTHHFPANESKVSSSMMLGDMGSHCTVPFAQQTWGSNWSDTRSGSVISGQYNSTLYPIVVSNNGTVQERWAIVFTSPTTYNLIGETLGQVGVGNTTGIFHPTNPSTSTPYFTIHWEGWSVGWVSNNVLRFNTISSDYPIALLRCLQCGPSSNEPDKVSIELIGDTDL